ncbi:hypothetical protein HRI_005153100 [Hibiscus trionum]|uniref:6,7-dimethyl-8-ribityllumazine synthase n=1 Tax=Hibiscus trionum TaxID=183268 RepID=A0A9W7JJX9_HIBTR|nr:hypothetical protein HRI_005153100 [Hibiscus trionum]
MGNSLRCCLACVLPCGALDLIRIVHLNGHVEEITRSVTAAEILDANPNHVLSKPTSQGVVRKILILSPQSHLKRGSIYFLIPADEKKKSHVIVRHKNSVSKSKKCDHNHVVSDSRHRHLASAGISETKHSGRSRRGRRNSRERVSQSHLISISED